MRYSICARTDPGRIRSNNEDAVAFDASLGLCVLADGLGGYNAGEVASDMATTFIRSEMAGWLRAQAGQASGSDIRRALQACVERVHRDIRQEARSNPQRTGMGSTLVVGVFDGPRLVLGHVGDSRCYRLREGVLAQLTKDHSRVQEQVDAGLLTPAQAAVAANRNLVTRALGAGTDIELELQEQVVEPQDLYLMCSDGLPDMVAEVDVMRILTSASSLEQRAQALIDAANERGGRDNITVLLVQAEAARTAYPATAGGSGVEL